MAVPVSPRKNASGTPYWMSIAQNTERMFVTLSNVMSMPDPARPMRKAVTPFV